MASSPITWWQIEGERVEAGTDFLFLGSKTTADGECSHEIKRQMLLGRKAITNLDSVLKSRDIILPTKVCIVKAMIFPVVRYGHDNWTIKKAESHRINAFKLWCWRRHLRVPWTARRSNHSILKEISPEYSLEGLMLKLKLQYFGHLMQRTDSLEKTLMLGKTEDRRRRGRQKIRWLGVITNLMDMSLSKVWELVIEREAWCAAFLGVGKNWTQLRFISLQSLSCIWFFVTPWTAAPPTSLSITNSQSFLKFMSIWVSDAIQPSYLLSSPSPPALNLSQHQSLFQWVNSSHEVAKVLEFQL